jgi:hypothetical protein
LTRAKRLGLRQPSGAFEHFENMPEQPIAQAPEGATKNIANFLPPLRGSTAYFGFPTADAAGYLLSSLRDFKF